MQKMPSPKVPANNLRALREAANLPLHRIVALVGRDTTSVRRWENGAPIPPQFLPTLAAFFKVRIGYLAGWEDENGDENGEAAA